ncbi:helix-turn-helix transcriptional regulator [Pseudomonas folii]|uniref:Helix-turn-helix transcriptional regulator n=1 Tax=Pseudomonas folii TaxID=2762593 RepID=A0ABR7B5D2_9PSED|nr:helix-turn-helix transcriptional regulator [Pseudomonas folii]MBC3952371.1 helix-turn-helix transcriptional regulator [Pseudomonas folii]
MKTTLLDQIRQRRLALGLKIQEMPLLAGLTRQQYGKIEAGGNPRLNTLDQIAEGLESALVLVPKSKLAAVQRILADDAHLEVNKHYAEPTGQALTISEEAENPWGDL